MPIRSRPRIKNTRSAKKERLPKKKKLTEAEKIAQIPIENIVKSGEAMQRKYLKTLSVGYKRRVASFKRKGVFSYAQDRYESNHPQLSARVINKMGYHQRILEIAKLQHFFLSETSSMEGIKAVNRRQDLRIFGQDKKGNPIENLSDIQRKAFWKLYDKYLNERPVRYPQSEYIQKILASIEIDDRTVEEIANAEKGEDMPVSALKVLDKLEKLISGEPDEDELEQENYDIEMGSAIPNVEMGRWDPDDF